MEPYIKQYMLFWVCIFGLCFGSFYNVVILRSLSGESIVFPSSKCPNCGNKLKPWHNIPVLSYLFLRGRCAFCNEKISIQYPIIELTSMVLFATSFVKFGLSWNTLFAMIICSTLLIMSMTDFKEKLVDCNIAIGLAIVGIVYNWLINGIFLDSIYGLLTGIVIMELIARTGYLFSKGRAFGEADTYVAAALGACFGLNGLFHILVYTLFAAALFIVPSFLHKQYKNNNKAVCIVFILFILSALIFKTLVQNWISLGILFSCGLCLIILILKNLRTESCPLYFPLVPAFSLATLYFLFF